MRVGNSRQGVMQGDVGIWSDYNQNSIVVPLGHFT